MTPEENDLLCRVEGDAPMGAIMRRHWIAACLPEEVAEPDGTPIRVKLLGENLVVFRDSKGRLGVLDEFCARTNLRFRMAAESNSFELLRSLVGYGEVISFQIQIGAPADNNKLGLVTREIDDRDVPRANLVLGQLRGRNLPVPTAVFADRLARSLDEMRVKVEA